MCLDCTGTYLGVPFQASSSPPSPQYSPSVILSEHTSFEGSDGIIASIQYKTTQASHPERRERRQPPIYVRMSREESAQSDKPALSGSSPTGEQLSRGGDEPLGSPTHARSRTRARCGCAGRAAPTAALDRVGGTRLFRLAFVASLRPERRRRNCCYCRPGFFSL